MLLPYFNCFKFSIFFYVSLQFTSTFTDSSLFLFDATSFAHQHLAFICHSSPHLFTSQALLGWMGAEAYFQVSPEIFDWVRAGSGWATPGHSQHCVYKPLLLCFFRSFVLLEGKPSARLRL